MKTTRKTPISLLGPLLCLAGCGGGIIESTGSGTPPTLTLGLPICDDTCPGTPQIATTYSGDGTAANPFDAILCSSQDSGNPYPGLVLNASSNTASIACNSATGITTVITSSTVTITSVVNNSSPVNLTCTASNSAGSFSYYLLFPATEDCCCFVAGTLVLMADGTTKRIEDIKVGEQVRAGNGDADWVCKFEQTVLGSRSLYSFNGSAHFVTPEHPFMTAQGWKAIDPVAAKREYPGIKISSLSVGDVLVLHGGEKMFIETIDSLAAERNLQLYNLDTSGDETYYVSLRDKFALVHA